MRALTALARARAWGQDAENWIVRGVILLLVVMSAWLAHWLVARAMAAAPRWRVAVPAGAMLLAAAALVLWMNPSLTAGRVEDPAVEGDTARFVFGGYPSRDALERLKAAGYTGVITLLHPAVVPFEPKLLADERRAAAAVGIPLVEAPMLPWVGSNEASLARIRALAASPEGRWFVHCYLGKDRVNVVRRAIAAVEPSVAVTDDAAAPRRLIDIPRFERGEIVDLGDSVYVIPFPTDEEWFGYVASGWVKSVVSLLDSANSANRPWIEREARIAADYWLPLVRRPVSARDTPRSLRPLADSVRALPRPVAVHGFLVPSPETDAFIAAWRATAPPRTVPASP